MKLVISALLITIPSAGLSQEPNAPGEFAPYWVAVQGNTQPSAIPFGEKMASFFTILSGEQKTGEQHLETLVAQRFAPVAADRERLIAAVSDNRLFLRQAHFEQGENLRHFCAEEPEDAQQIASRLTEIESKRLVKLEAHYKNILSTLEQTVQSRVLSDADTSVAPYMIYGSFDYAAMAARQPDMITSLFSGMCQGLLSASAATPSDEDIIESSEAVRVRR